MHIVCLNDIIWKNYPIYFFTTWAVDVTEMLMLLPHQTIKVLELISCHQEGFSYANIIDNLQTPKMTIQDLEEEEADDEVPGTPPAKRVRY